MDTFHFVAPTTKALPGEELMKLKVSEKGRSDHEPYQNREKKPFK